MADEDGDDNAAGRRGVRHQMERGGRRAIR